MLITSVSGEFDNKNAGLGKTVALTTTYGGAQRTNYLITDQTTANASIEPRVLTANYVGQDR